MKYLIVYLFFSVYHFLHGNAQSIVEVTEQTLKIGGTKEEELLFGFAKGDKIIFHFSEINGKELKEVEIVEYPSASKYSGYKTSKIENRVIAVAKQGVYIFRFKNSALGGRVCRIHIQRIPADASTAGFNTAVEWINRQDTIWQSYTKDVLIGYDTLILEKLKKELASTVKQEEILIDKMERVHSTTNGNGNKSWIYFKLPQNIQEGNTIRRVIAWAYWIGVGEDANKAWQQNQQAIKTSVKSAAMMFSTPLGALAAGVVVDLMLPKLGEDVKYSLVNGANKDLFMAGKTYKGWDHGKGVAGYKRFTDASICQGTYYICMSNDNLMQGIDVNVKVSVLIETRQYKDVAYTERQLKPLYEKRILREPIIKTVLAPITGQ